MDGSGAFQALGIVICNRKPAFDKTRDMKLPSWLAACVVVGIFAVVVNAVSAEEPTNSPAPLVSDPKEAATARDTTSEDATKEVDSSSPDGKFAFLMGRGEDERTIDLVD